MSVARRGFTVRAALLGAAAILANSYWLGYVEMIWHTAHLTTVALPLNVLFALFVLTAANAVMKATAPRRALEPGELLTVYSMLATGSAFVGHDFMPRLMGLIPHAFRYASAENDWDNLFFRHLPSWLVVRDTDAVRAFYEGGARFWRDGYALRWLIPLLSWAGIILLLMVVFLCVTVLFREQWVSRERLAYPLIQIPYEMTAETAQTFRATGLWVGFGLAAGLNLWNGLQYFFPVLPEIPVKRYDLLNSLPERPWSAMGSTPLRFHPFLIGLAFLLPIDLSFSVVFFYAMRKAQYVLGDMAAIPLAGGYPFLGEQGAGAIFALLFVTCWTGRRHFLRILARLKHPEHTESEKEAISYRAALTGIGTATVILAGICVAAGMTLVGFGAYFLTYLAIVLGVTRMRAELGPPIHAIGYATPQHLLISLFGTRVLGTRNLTVLSLLNWLSGASYASFRTHPMPDQMEAFKLADKAGISNRGMFGALLLAGCVGVFGSLLMYPTLIHKEGVPAAAEQIHAGGQEGYTLLASWIRSPQPPNWAATGVLVGTFVANLGIFAMRSRFFWCPLHPAGYVIGVAPGTTDLLWFPLFLAFALKWTLLRFGGFQTYRRAIPVCMGLVMGEAVVGCFWPLVSLVTRGTVYSWI